MIKNIIFIFFFGIIHVVNCNFTIKEHILSTRFENEPVRECNGGLGECVPYYQCPDGNWNTDGGDIFDVRFQDECVEYFENCCNKSDVKTKEEVQISTVSPPTACGIRNPNGIGVRVTGIDDNEAEYGEFPWMAAIFEKRNQDNEVFNVYICGGSLISNKVVLTAAHCVRRKKAENIWIRVGDWDTQSNNERYIPSDHPVEKIILHEKFYSGGLYNDIALLFLNDGPELTTLVNTICLPPQNQKYDGKNCIVSGWGKDVSGIDGRYQSIMKKIELPTVEPSVCEKSLNIALNRTEYTLHESFMCAGGEAGKDACEGDGGSPLVCPIDGHPGQYYQAGIVSWGVGCGKEYIPGVYVDVSKFSTWIDQKMSLA